MLTSLGKILIDRGPLTRGVAPADPLETIVAAWPEIAGRIASNTRPSALKGDTLLVDVQGSVYAQELAFAAPTIVTKLQALVPRVCVAKIASRTARSSGGPRSLGPAAPRASDVDIRATALAAVRSTPTTTAPAEDAQTALARMRATAVANRRSYLSAGARACADCGTLTTGVRRCVVCRDRNARNLEISCARLLHEHPELRPAEVLHALPEISRSCYERMRTQSLKRWWDEMRRAAAALRDGKRVDSAAVIATARRYVLVLTQCGNPAAATADHPLRRNSLGELYDVIRALDDSMPRLC